MAINIDEFRTSILNVANKWRSGHLPPYRGDDFTNQAQYEIFNEKYLAATQNNKIDDDLAPFLISENVAVDALEGVNYALVIRPQAYAYFWMMRAFLGRSPVAPNTLVSCGCPTSKDCVARNPITQEEIPLLKLPIIKETRVEKVDGGRWDAMLQHRNKYPTLEKPKCTQFAQGYKVAPRDLQIVTLDYYRMPVKAKFNYTLLPSGYYEYNPVGSVDLEWGEQVKNEILDRALLLFSIYLRDKGLYEMSQNLKATRI